VVLDRGEVATGDRSKSLCEIEIELKAGDKAELFKSPSLAPHLPNWLSREMRSAVMSLSMITSQQRQSASSSRRTPRPGTPFA
jgi:inorganic triphosphatase YgiF